MVRVSSVSSFSNGLYTEYETIRTCSSWIGSRPEISTRSMLQLNSRPESDFKATVTAAPKLWFHYLHLWASFGKYLDAESRWQFISHMIRFNSPLIGDNDDDESGLWRWNGLFTHLSWWTVESKDDDQSEQVVCVAVLLFVIIIMIALYHENRQWSRCKNCFWSPSTVKCSIIEVL